MGGWGANMANIAVNVLRKMENVMSNNSGKFKF